MKKIVTLLTFTCLLSFAGSAQQANTPTAPAAIGCIDKDIILQVEDVKHGFTEKGMKIYKDAMVSMESEMPYSVEVKLQKDHQYQFIYMGSEISTKSSIELLDGEDHSITKKEMKHGEQPGYITFSYKPAKTDIYLVVLYQKQKRANMCGSFTIFEDGQTK